jgi:hypothetical protein
MVRVESNGMYFHKIFPEDKRRTTKIGFVRTQDSERFPITYQQDTIF